METSFRAVPSRENERSYNGHYMRAGKAAEKIVMEWLYDRPEIIGVEDLRALRQMREADVDVSISLYDGRIALAEIKSDWHLGISGNLLFEVLRINHTCQPDRSCTLGWSSKSPATWLLFYAPQVQIIYRIPFNEYRIGFQRYTRENNFTARITRTDAIKTTVNVLIPEKYFNGIDVYKIHAG